MSEIEDRINKLLGDPEQLEKITKMAQSLMGGESAAGGAPLSGALGDLARGMGGDGGEPLLDPAMLGKISRLMSAGGGRDREERALLEAMKPYLTEKRRNKMDKALKIAKLARVARLAMGEMGEDGGL